MTDLIEQIRDFLLSDPQLSQKMERVNLTDGQVLFERGDPDSAFYLIQSGQIKIYTGEQDGQEVFPDILGAEKTLGEMALIDERSHAVNAVSLGSSVVLRLSRDEFWQQVHTSPELSQWIIQLLSQRIDYLLEYIANIRDWIQQIIAGEYDRAIDNVEEMELESHRFDQSYFSVSLLVAVTESLKRMIQTVRQIKEGQLQQRAKLKLEIDNYKHQQQVEEIVSADYFSYLVELAERRNTVSNTEKSGESLEKVLPFYESPVKSSSQDRHLAVKQALIKGLQKRSEIFNNLIIKAWEDEQFRQELLTNPKAVYAREFDCEVPEELEIQAIEETIGTIKMVLPINPFSAIVEEELSDKALDAIAGGNWAAIKDIFDNS